MVLLLAEDEAVIALVLALRNAGHVTLGAAATVFARPSRPAVGGPEGYLLTSWPGWSV